MSTPAKFLSSEQTSDLPVSDSTTADVAPSPSGRGVTGIVQICAVIAVVTLAILYAREPAAPGQVAPAAAVPAEQGVSASVTAPSVRVVMPQVTSSTLSVATNGSVGVRNYVALTPQVGGAVVSVAQSMRSGGEFQAGEILFEIDSRDYQLALDQANADVSAAENRLKLIEAEGNAARGNYALLHGDAPVPMLVAKEPQIDLSRAELDAARARAARAQLDLSRTQFSLPFAGRVTSTNVGVGQMLAKGQSVGQVFALEALEVSVPISAQELAGIAPAAGRNATIQLAGQSIPAVVDRISAELDPRTRFATLYLSLRDDIAIAPGTFVDVTLFGDVVADSFLLPEAAEQAGSAVWVVEDGALRSLTPEILARTADGLVVSAFDTGQGIVLGSVPGATKNMAVNPVIVSTPQASLAGIGH